MFKCTLTNDASDAASAISGAGHSFVLKLMQGSQDANESQRGRREVHFYESVAAMSHGHLVDGLTYEALHGLGGYLAQYHGVLRLEPETQAAWGAGPEYLVFGNVSSDFVKPCVLDLKIGTQTFEPDAPASKQARDLAKYPHQAEIGFRLIGMRVLTYGEDGELAFQTKDKTYGRSLEPERAYEGLATFLHNGRALRTDVIVQFLEELEGLIACFEKQTAYHFYSTSLLLVYDGHEGEGAGTEVVLKMIDFAHVRTDTAGRRDEGFLYGLTNLQRRLREFVVQGLPDEFSGGLLQPRD